MKKPKVVFLKQYLHNSEMKKRSFWSIFITFIHQSFYSKPFIISAERTGASMFERELSINKNEVLNRISQIREKNFEREMLDLLINLGSRYPKPVKDNIDFVSDIELEAKRTSYIQKNQDKVQLFKMILDLFHEVAGGKYIITKGSGIMFAPGAKKRATKGKIPITRASSSVRSLLMLNYYILHTARSNDILMIDEPELNLHPKNQILIARLLALLVNAGIKVFITTHSDYIVRELSNCIMLNNLAQE